VFAQSCGAGKLYGIGYNTYGLLGDGTSSSLPTWSASPVSMTAYGSIIDYAVGGNFTIIINSAGKLWGWGENTWGRSFVIQLTFNRPTWRQFICKQTHTSCCRLGRCWSVESLFSSQMWPTNMYCTCYGQYNRRMGYEPRTRLVLILSN
jgi:alpha-tubulin suppressor-like RCC1 family protein